MKMILSSRRYPYIARVGVFLIALALIVGTTGCNGPYSLTMAVDPPGGGTTVPSVGTHSYPIITNVPITASADWNYQFDGWTAVPPVTFGDATSNVTDFTIAQNVTVTAHFVRVLDHFKCYRVPEEEILDKAVYLEDQFGTVNATVGWAELFCNPVVKGYPPGVSTPISHPDHHLTVYTIECQQQPEPWTVTFSNQFGNQTLNVEGRPVYLAVPTQKVQPGDHQPPQGLDHFLLYKVSQGPVMNVIVQLEDQFHYEQQVLVLEPVFFANPVRKTHGANVTPIMNPDVHLVFYKIQGGNFTGQVAVDNQFGHQTLDVYDPVYLAVPSEKLAYYKITVT